MNFGFFHQPDGNNSKAANSSKAANRFPGAILRAQMGGSVYTQTSESDNAGKRKPEHSYGDDGKRMRR